MTHWNDTAANTLATNLSVPIAVIVNPLPSVVIEA